MASIISGIMPAMNAAMASGFNSLIMASNVAHCSSVYGVVSESLIPRPSASTWARSTTFNGLPVLLAAVTASSAVVTASPAVRPPAVEVGLERLASYAGGRLSGKRLGLVVHAASITADGRYVVLVGKCLGSAKSPRRFDGVWVHDVAAGTSHLAADLTAVLAESFKDPRMGLYTNQYAGQNVVDADGWIYLGVRKMPAGYARHGPQIWTDTRLMAIRITRKQTQRGAAAPK